MDRNPVATHEDKRWRKVPFLLYYEKQRKSHQPGVATYANQTRIRIKFVCFALVLSVPLQAVFATVLSVLCLSVCSSASLTLFLVYFHISAFLSLCLRHLCVSSLFPPLSAHHYPSFCSFLGHFPYIYYVCFAFVWRLHVSFLLPLLFAVCLVYCVFVCLLLSILSLCL